MAAPIMVAVGGDSGTGKATLCNGLREIFGSERCSELHLDGYFALNRLQRNAVGMSPLDPRVHDFAAMGEDLYALAHGEAVTKPVYEHTKGDITGTIRIEPRDIVLVQGRFALYTHALRSLFDVNVWLDREGGYRVPWTVHRPFVPSEHTDVQLRAAAERRTHDYERYIAPQKRYADIDIVFGERRMQVTTSGRLAAVDRTDLATPSSRVHLLEETGTPYRGSYVEVDASIPDETADRMQHALWSRLGVRQATAHIEQLGRYTIDGKESESRPLALAQLIVARHIDVVAAHRLGRVGA